MTENQRIWADSRNRLIRAVSSLGYPKELAELLARELRSPRAIDRMTSYLVGVRPPTMEMIVDEMLAIRADTEAWRAKIESREAQAGYNNWLRSEERMEAVTDFQEDIPDHTIVTEPYFIDGIVCVGLKSKVNR